LGGGGGVWAQIDFASVVCSGVRQGDAPKNLQVKDAVRKLTSEILSNDQSRVLIDDEGRRITFKTQLPYFHKAVLVAVVNYELNTAYTIKHVEKMRKKSYHKQQAPPPNQAAQPFEQPPAQTRADPPPPISPVA
jgi:hypothetical protein